METDVGRAWSFLRLGCDGSDACEVTPNSCGVEVDVVVGFKMPGDGVCSGVMSCFFESGSDLSDEVDGALWGGCWGVVGSSGFGCEGCFAFGAVTVEEFGNPTL